MDMTMMQRWELPVFGRSNLMLGSAPRPVAGPGQVLVKVEAVSLNFRDLLILDNNLGSGYSVPLVPGSDFAGKVEEVGEGVTRFRPGDRVISNDIAGWVDGDAPTAQTNKTTILGRLSPYVVEDPEQLVLAPASLTAVEAATLPCAGLTAWMTIVELGRVRAGQTIVIQGTGGVSMFAIQLALAHGARVIVTTSSADKIERLRQIGEIETINRSDTPEWQQEVLKLTGPRGADHIVEMAGGDNVGRSLEAVALGGRISMVGLLGDQHFSGPTGCPPSAPMAQI